VRGGAISSISPGSRDRPCAQRVPGGTPVLRSGFGVRPLRPEIRRRGLLEWNGEARASAASVHHAVRRERARCPRSVKEEGRVAQEASLSGMGGVPVALRTVRVSLIRSITTLTRASRRSHHCHPGDQPLLLHIPQRALAHTRAAGCNRSIFQSQIYRARTSKALKKHHGKEIRGGIICDKGKKKIGKRGKSKQKKSASDVKKTNAPREKENRNGKSVKKRRSHKKLEHAPPNAIPQTLAEAAKELPPAIFFSLPDHSLISFLPSSACRAAGLLSSRLTSTSRPP